MNRHGRRVPLRSGVFPPKRDTPVKTALPLRRRGKIKRRVSSIHECPTLSEEPEVVMNETPVKPVGQVSAVPVHCRSVSRLSSPAISEIKRSQTAPSDTPANKTPVHLNTSQTTYLTSEVTPVIKALDDDDTPDSVLSCSMEPDSTLNSEEDDDEDEDDHRLSSSSNLSSLPSPEIFRKEVETTTFPNKNELLSVNLPIRNSTLLECSHSENIHLHRPPDLSIIIGDAAVNPAKTISEIRHQKIPENRSKIQTNSKVKSEIIDNSPKMINLPKFTKRKLILCKKKVWFKSPITTEVFKSEHISPPTSASRSTSESSGQMELDPEASKMGEISSKCDTFPLLVTLKQPVTRSSATFFDFGNDNERAAFFQRMSKRSTKLRSFAEFPSRLDTQNSLLCDC